MALTRKMLAAMDIPAEKIDEIISAHTETVNAIKEERDDLKEKVAGFGSLQKDLDKANKDLEEANAEIEKFKSGDWENKYKTIKGEYDNFKTETETKATKAKKENAFKQLLIDSGISDKRIASIMKVSGETVDSVELDDEGKIKDADKLAESVKTEWADFIVSQGTQGATTPKPPTNGGGDDPKQPSRAAQMVAAYRNEHYGNPKED